MKRQMNWINFATQFICIQISMKIHKLERTDWNSTSWTNSTFSIVRICKFWLVRARMNQHRSVLNALPCSMLSNQCLDSVFRSRFRTGFNTAAGWPFRMISLFGDTQGQIWIRDVKLVITWFCLWLLFNCTVARSIVEVQLYGYARSMYSLYTMYS